MKRLLTWLACAALTLSLGACSDKDDDNGIDPASLVGEWVCTYQQVVEGDGTVSLESAYSAADNYRLLLRADGTGLLVTGNNGGDSLLEWDSGNELPLTYSVSGNEIHAVVYRYGLTGTGSDEVYKITSQSETALELYWDEYSYKITCRFIRK